MAVSKTPLINAFVYNVQHCKQQLLLYFDMASMVARVSEQ
jgi:hypothetical protein